MMEEKKVSLMGNALIWFGAGVSIAEIMTGSYFASLGLKKGLAAIIIGHVIGCILLFLAGLIGAKTRKSAMETVQMSFGEKGSLLFSSLNVLQLVGWTAIMIYDGAIAANYLVNVGTWIWSLVIGGLIILWICIGIKQLNKLNVITMAALFALTVMLCKSIFVDTVSQNVMQGELSFGGAVELGVAMPLSWLPLISDYTREAEKPVAGTLVSVVTYGAVSCWMYIIGMGATIITGQSSIANIMLKVGSGVGGIMIIIFSTVTTTFLDAYSAGISVQTISKKITEKYVAIIVTMVGILGASMFPMEDITSFLYFIGSVFAPMVAIQLLEFFVLKKEGAQQGISRTNLMIWLIGFVVYRFLMTKDIIIGSGLPDMMITAAIYLSVYHFRKHLPKKG